MAASKYGCRYGSRPESFTDVVVEMRRTVFVGAAADADALSDAAALADALADAAAEADSLAAAEADALAAELEALLEPPEQATMNSANSAANTVASKALYIVLLFIASLPL